MISAKLLVVIICVLWVGHVQCSDRIPDRTCATLYSSEDYDGESFTLKDFDQSANFKRDYRYAPHGWLETSAIRVADGCKMVVCDDVRFMGTCQLLNAGDHITKQVQSANCTCNRACTCEDLDVVLDHKFNISSLTGVMGRAYLNGDCYTCDTEYFMLRAKKNKQFMDFPENARSKVKAIILPKGCNMTIRADGAEEINITEPLYLGFNGIINTYKLSCDSTQFVPPPPSKWKSSEDHPLEMPQELSELYAWQDTRYPNHPGIKYAITSAENGKSFNSVTVVVIGTSAVYYDGFPHCKPGNYWGISVCRIPVWQEDIGLNITLRVVTISFGQGLDDVNFQNKLVSTLEKYLSPEGDSNGRRIIPNAVIFFHNVGDGITEESSLFQQKLQLVQKMRASLLDEDNSNFLFLLTSYFFASYEITDSGKREKENLIPEYENVIGKYLELPVRIIVNTYGETADMRYVNGYRKSAIRDYWPRNLEMNLVNICEKGNDPLGKAVLSAYFQDNRTPHYSIFPIDLAMITSHGDVTTEISGPMAGDEMITEEGWIWDAGQEPLDEREHRVNSQEGKMSSHERLESLIRENEREIWQLKTEVEIDKLRRQEDAERKLEIWDRVQFDLRQLFE